MPHVTRLKVTLTTDDLETIREALIFKLQRIPALQKGKKVWQRFNAAYDNLIDAVNDAKELRPLEPLGEDARKALKEALDPYRGRRTIFDPKGKH